MPAAAFPEPVSNLHIGFRLGDGGAPGRREDWTERLVQTPPIRLIRTHHLGSRSRAAPKSGSPIL